jgi:competence protein ComGC
MIVIILSSLLTLFFVLSIILLIRGINLVKQNETLQDVVVENQEERYQTQVVL